VAELLDVKEFTGVNTLEMELWAARMAREATGHEHVVVFHWRGGRLQLDPNHDEDTDLRLVNAGEYVAALLHTPEPVVEFVKAGAWTYGHNIARYTPEADVHAEAEWPGDDYEEMVRGYCEKADELAADQAEDSRAALFDEVGTEDNDRVPAFPGSVDMRLRSMALIGDTPLVEGKGYLLQIPDNRGRVVEFFLRWDKTAVPDSVLGR
jgi:hypothetical protein